jgi:hypothetical protein
VLFCQDFDWSDVDSEEEAFATQLAEKLMESSGNGKANFDDEDPDMDDWSDLGSDDDEQDDDGDEVDGMNHEDAFMDADSSDDEEQHMEGINRDESESDSFEGFGMLGNSDDEASSDEEDMNAKKKSSKGQKRKKAEASIYADAEEYEKVIKRR